MELQVLPRLAVQGLEPIYKSMFELATAHEPVALASQVTVTPKMVYSLILENVISWIAKRVSQEKNLEMICSLTLQGTVFQVVEKPEQSHLYL